MKKIISLILTVAMLLSITTFVAPVSAEQTRDEILNAPMMEYLDIPFTNDGFATAAEVYKYYPRDSTLLKFPSTDVDGNPITNHINGYFAKKSFNNKVFTIDSILGNSEGKVTGKYFDASNAVKNYSYDLKVNGNSKFALESTETDGTMNFLYNHNDVSFKMGPIGGTGAHLTSTGGYNVHVLPNAVDAYATKSTIENPKSVNILMSTHTVNGDGNAGLFPVEITYADETTETKYVLSTSIMPSKPNRVAFMDATGGSSNNEGDGDRLAKTIIYVPKTTDISTGANITAAEGILSETNAVEITGKAITLDDVKFPNDDLIIKGESVLFGDLNNARTDGFKNPRQWCNVGYVDYLSIPVDKKVTSVHMKRDTEVAKTWKDAITNGHAAYLPVTIEGASEDYYYFAKLGRLCKDEQEVYAVTVVGESLQDKIDAVEVKIAALDDEYNNTDEVNKKLGEIKNDMAALKEEGVLDTDYDPILFVKYEKLYAEAEDAIIEKKVDDWKDRVDKLPETYVYTMRAEVESINDEYKALVDSGISKSKFDEAVLEKLKNLNAVYEKAAALEDTVSLWGVYIPDLYESVKNAVTALEALGGKEANAVNPDAVEKIENYDTTADSAHAIDLMIEELGEGAYNDSMLSSLIAIEKKITALKNTGVSVGVLAKYGRFEELYANVEGALAFLDEREQQFVDLSAKANIDMFTTFANITNYAYFNKDGKGAAAAYSNLSSKYTAVNGETLNLVIPNTTYEGKTITGSESYYAKGFNKTTPTLAQHIYVLDDLIGKNGEVVSGYRFNTENANQIVDAGGTIERTEAKHTVNTSNVKEVLEDGKYAVVEDNGRQIKVGPLTTDAEVYSPNAVYLSNNGDVTVPVAKTGKRASVLITTSNINSGVTATSIVTGATPVAGIQNIEITYKDGTTEKKYVVVDRVTSNSALSTAEKAVWYAPKQDKWTSADIYGDKRVSGFNQLSKGNADDHGVDLSKLTAEDFVFENENIIMSDAIKVATIARARQDAATYGNKASLATIPLKDSEVTEMKLSKVYDYATMSIPSVVVITGTNTRQAFIPVTINGANDKYDYFIYVGGLTDNTYLMGMTIEGESLQEKLDDAEAKMAELTENSEISEIAAVKSAVDALAEKGVESAFYDEELYENFNEIYEANKDAVDQYVYTHPQVTSITTYTSLENMTYTIKFSAPVSKDSITKKNFAVSKNGNKDFTGYSFKHAESEIKEIEILIPNDYDYNADYSLTISADVKGMGSAILGTTTVKEYNAKPAVDAKISLVSGKGKVTLTNNLKDASDVTAIVCVYDANNRLVDKDLVYANLAASGGTTTGDVEVTVSEGQKIECLILDSLTNCKKIYNTYIFE